ncbi:MAG TPA: CopD family protein [Ktedonobacteraceae bacterium]|nr:CopD family protein [Ktedonobacteraceae bacterium]
MNRSRRVSWTSVAHRLVLMIFPLAFLAFFLFPQDVSAHAILLRSSPDKLAVLTASPAQVYMWFSEDLNPAYSTAFVIKAGNSADDVKTHVDKSDAHVSYTDSREMDLSLKPNLPSAAYIVLYRTQSADDGHILYGFFIFKVAAANGTVPTFNGAIPQPYASGVEESGGLQLDEPALLSLVMTTLVDLGTIFWVGAQIWFCFVLPDLESENQEQQTICGQMQQRFNRGFSWSVLLLVLLANMGVLIGQALSITGGDWGAAFEPVLLISLVNQGHFGTYWIMREIVILLPLVLLTVHTVLVKQPSQQVSSSISWGNFALGVALLVALTQSGHAAATSSNVLVYAVLADFLHLAASALWIGGMMFIAVIYLPMLKSRSWQQQTASLLIILPRYSPLALTGVVLMGLSGPLNAATRLLSWDQLFTTVYGLMLIVKVLLVVAMLLTSAFHVLLLRPRLAKNFKTYQAATEAGQSSEEDKPVNRARISVAQMKRLEARIKRQTRELSTILRWEPVLGIAVLLCTGLLTVFSGTLQPTTTSQPTAQILSAPSKPFTATVETTDKQFSRMLKIDPKDTTSLKDDA